MEKRVSPSEVKQKITSHVSEQATEDKEKNARQRSLEAQYHLEGLQSFYQSRKVWSWFLIGAISLSLVFQFVITILVGANALVFTQYKWFLPLVVSENFIQVISLALIVVRWLFSGAKPNKMFEGRD